MSYIKNIIYFLVIFLGYNLNAKDSNELVFHNNPKKIENILLKNINRYRITTAVALPATHQVSHRSGNT